MIKRCIASVLLLSSFLWAFPKFVGDLNGDGTLSVSDVTVLMDIIVNGQTDYDKRVADVNEDDDVTVADVSLLVNMIVQGIAPKEIVDTDDIDTLYIDYAETGATYRMPSAWKDYLTVTVNGGMVSVVNTNTTDEYVTSLSGTCSNGSFTYTGTYKTTIVLNGLTLTNPTGGCLDVEDGKRVNLKLADGTVSTLTDGAGAQKAAVYSKGHTEVSGGGTLYVSGNTKHAIRSKEYLQLKSSTGAIHILGAASDGIHVGQYFEMKGGTVTMEGVQGDGIQVEALLEGDENDGQMMVKGGAIDITLTGSDVAALKSDSLMTVSGGDITIHSTGADVKGLKSDGDILISDGTLHVTQSGGYLVSEETTDAGTVSDPSFTTGIRSNGDITVSGGTLTLVNTADGGRGMNADGAINIQGGTLDIQADGNGGVLDLSSGGSVSSGSYRIYVALPMSGMGGGPGQMGGQAWTNVYLCDNSGEQVAQLMQQASFTVNGRTTTFYYYDFGTTTSGTYYFKSDNYTSRGVSYAIRTSAFTISLTGSDAFYSIANSYQTNSGTRTYSISNVTSTYANASTATEEGETFKAFCLKADGDVTLSGGDLTLSHSGIISKGIKSDGTVAVGGGTLTDTASGTYMIIGSDPAYCTSVKCQDYVGTAGQVTVSGTGSASRAISADGTLTITGGTYDLTLSGDGATYTGNGSTEGAGSRGLKSDGDMRLEGGTITILSSARGGKGIKVGTSEVSGVNGAQLIVGSASTGLGPVLTVSTTGSYLSTNSSGFGGMGGMNEGFIGSCKAVKCMGPITVNGGTLTLSTANDSGEGLESKSTITVNGGTMESYTYDDAINAASTITFNGGNVWAHSFGNDAIDSNDRTTGIVINDGVVIASGSTSPEEGFDCDNAAFIVNGGTVIGTGGAQGNGGGVPTKASQPYVSLSSVTLTANTFLSLKDKSGKVVCSYKIPRSTDRATILMSSPALSTGSSATVVYGSTGVSNPATSLWDGTYTTGATLTGGSSRSVTPTTK